MKMLALVTVILAAAVAHGQTCNDRIAFATPNGRFDDRGNGTVTDLRTGLTWQRCPVGFAFDDNGTPALNLDDQCIPSGPSTFTWQQALQSAAALNQGGGYAGSSDWRLPNVKELTSIVETRCAAPSINLTVFPGTPALSSFWSSSYHVGPPTFTSARAVDFSTGQDGQLGRTAVAYVRLVR